MEKVYGLADEKSHTYLTEQLPSPDLVTWLTPDQLDDVSIDHGSRMLLYLSQQQVLGLMDRLMDKQCSVAFLPHPELKHLSGAYGMPGKLKESLALALRPESFKEVELLLCNGLPVFAFVKIGHLMQLGSHFINPHAGWWQKIVSLFRVSHRKYVLETAKEQTIETVASGMLVLPGRQSVAINELFSDAPSIKTGRLNVLVFAPKSLFGAFKIFVMEWWGDRFATQSLPEGVGYLQSSRLSIRSPYPMDYRLDGVSVSAKTIELEMKPEALQICQGEAVESKNRNDEEAADKETLKTHRLPKGEEVETLENRHLPLFRHASSEDFKELFGQIRDNVRFDTQFGVLLCLSVIIAALGLFMNSGPVIIGAMILAPLMSPIISLSAGLIRMEQGLILRSGRTLLIGVLLSLGLACLISLLMPLHNLTNEMSSRTFPNLLDLWVALFSGVAGAYATANESVAKSVAGVAIAVALVPPLAVAGIGLGWAEWWMFQQAFLLFATNLFGIAFGAAVTFWVMGFAPLKLAQKGLMYVVIVLAILAIPLTVSFQSILEQNTLGKRLEGFTMRLEGGEEVHLNEVTIMSVSDEVQVSAVLESHRALRNEEMRRLKQKAESLLERPAVLRLESRIIY